MNQPQPKSSFSGAGLGVTAVLAMVLCCAAPALVAGGLLASLGAVIGSPAVIASASPSWEEPSSSPFAGDVAATRAAYPQTGHSGPPR
ncbi:MAG: hypothetical protein H0T19_08680 [Thermoleophilaceae bacterium]|nr:hypothetical protein [Thermoleophilaceae bacterium]